MPTSIGAIAMSRRKQSRATQSKPQAHTIKQACLITGLGKSMLYLLISKGRLRTVTVGRRRLVLADSIAELLTPGATAA